MSQKFEDNTVLQKALVLLITIGLKISDSKVQSWDLEEETNYDLLINNYDTGFTMNSPGCSIPRMKVDDLSIKKLIHYPWEVPSCPDSRHALLRSNQTHIWIIKEHYKYYRINDETKLYCCYRSFYQKSTTSRSTSGKIVYLSCIKFDKIIEISNEFVKVECFHKNKVVYKEFFVFIPKRHFKLINKKTFRNGKHHPKFNVIILGLSSVSRLNFHRSMPNTYNLLSKLGAIELLGYHTISDDTLGNVLTILTGMSLTELNTTFRFRTKQTLDKCPFVWEKYKDSGYYTALIQDTPSQGFFNSFYGFNDIPTDYFIQPYLQESAVKKNQAVNSLLNQWKKTANSFVKLWQQIKALKPSKFDKPLCLGSKYYFKHLLEYIEGLTSILRSSRLFGTFWETSLPQSLNAPMLMDHGYERLIQKLNYSGYLNNTILIMVTDKGINGPITETKQGRLEKRLPLATILMPPAFRDDYDVAYESLKINSNRLTTPFDLYETLSDLSDLNILENKNVLKRIENKLEKRRGVSLFVPIHSNRTCEKAAIANKMCTCHKTKEITLKSHIVKNAVRFVIAQLNWLLRMYPQCVQLEVDKVLLFEEMWPSYAEEVEWREFKFAISVKPGYGKYEALLRHDDEDWSLMAHIRRLDEYTGQGYCVHDDMIKMYCFCRLLVFT